MAFAEVVFLPRRGWGLLKIAFYPSVSAYSHDRASCALHGWFLKWCKRRSSRADTQEERWGNFYEKYSRREIRYRWKTLTLNDGKKRSKRRPKVDARRNLRPRFMVSYQASSNHTKLINDLSTRIFIFIRVFIFHEDRFKFYRARGESSAKLVFKRYW